MGSSPNSTLRSFNLTTSGREGRANGVPDPSDPSSSTAPSATTSVSSPFRLPSEDPVTSSCDAGLDDVVRNKNVDLDCDDAESLETGTAGHGGNRRKASEAAPPRQQYTSKNLCLVVDDSPTILKMVVRILKQLGWYAAENVITASNGEEGLKLMKLQEYDFVLTDLEMPLMDGHKMVTEYHSHRQGSEGGAIPDQRVFSMSSNGQKQDEIRSGADAAMYAGFLSKPVTADKLINIIGSKTHLGV